MTARILICDDEADMRVWLRARLQSFGHEVLVAENGNEALTCAQAELPDLLILDLNMAGIDGFAVCSELRSCPQTRHIPIIMLTSQRTTVDDRVRGLRLGADDYLLKDVAPEELDARIISALRRGAMAGELSPLTRLPGNSVITDVITARLAHGQPFGLAWGDIDNFKAFNDHYGFARGDEMILLTARIMREVAQEQEGESPFIGHVGGDDFVILSNPDNILEIGEDVIQRVDERFPDLYDAQERALGCIQSVDRKGNPETFPIASISIAVVLSTTRPFENVLDVMQVCAEMKKVAKSREGSQIVVDRRTS
jgi:PleD family two-component response regulator